MKTISSYMASDHHRCDALFAAVEAHINERQWEQAELALQHFQQALEQHLGMEEEILFPAFEQATGSTDGPIGVLRSEHSYMRAITDRMRRAVWKKDIGGFFDHGDTLRIIMGQHNQKEETILYFMTERILADRQSDIIAAMDEMAATVASV